MRTGCSTPSTPPNPAVWEWDFQSAVRSWKPTVAGYGPRQTYPTAPRFSSPCRRMPITHHEVAAPPLRQRRADHQLDLVEEHQGEDGRAHGMRRENHLGHGDARRQTL